LGALFDRTARTPIGTGLIHPSEIGDAVDLRVCVMESYDQCAPRGETEDLCSSDIDQCAGTCTPEKQSTSSKDTWSISTLLGKAHR
jgi:hypothetical protein